ncbi:hypothetical protein H8E77_06125 [bacterium]|nr:hypothetical protein [bacterium]
MKNSTQSQIYNEYSLEEQILRECEAMAKYAFASGLEVPGTLVESLDTLSKGLRRAEGYSEESTAKDQKNSGVTASTHLPTNKAKELAKIHNRLAEIAVPATPRTILLLEPKDN